MLTVLFLLLVGCSVGAVNGYPASPEEPSLHQNGTNKTSPNYDSAVEENGGYFEGDIRYPERMSPLYLRNFRPNLWPNGVIYYRFENSYSQSGRKKIIEALRDFTNYTCLRAIQLSKYDRKYDYVRVIEGGGCSSYIGRVRGRQNLSLAPGCLKKGTILHEFMHAAGMAHEHNRPDRDNYINVHWNRISQEGRISFEKFNSHPVQTPPELYDISSLMHYGKYAFSNNGLATMTGREGVDDALMGQRRRLTKLDIYKINKLYRCPDTSNTESK